MTNAELAVKLGLPATTKRTSIANRAIRKHCPGGGALLTAIEWASGVESRSHDAGRRALGADCMDRLEEIRMQMVYALEQKFDVPEGELALRARLRNR